MKNLLLLSLLLFSLNTQAQYSTRIADDNTGLMITANGLCIATIAVFVKDGGEYTFQNGYNSNKISTPVYNRIVMFGVGITVSIGGLIYHKNHK